MGKPDELRVAAIVYGAASGIVRRVVVSERLGDLAAPTVLGKGEDIIILAPQDVLKNGVPDLTAANALIAAKIGKPVEIGRAVVIDDKSGEIVGVIMADPSVDAIPGKTLFQHGEAAIGWSVDKTTGEFTAPASVV